MSMIAKNRTKSSWTPLSNEETNNKIFEERSSLLGKWYDKWTDEQRRKVLEDLMNRSKIKQLKFVQEIVNEKVPCIREDFTRELPKILSVYIFSFLDPRSLSRCARNHWARKDEYHVESFLRRERGYYGYEAEEITRQAKSKVKTGTNVLNQSRKSQSLSLLNYSEDAMSNQRPQWATMNSPYVSFEAKVVDKNKRNISPTRNTGNSSQTFSPIKPGSRPVTARSERDPPTARLFPEKPWKVPDGMDSDEDI
ncbi:uncharacterized protein LOC134265337 [Saccostrea cucullata]|uniref:uncharacterized protein LOC134265337 n=1 Tax=Saccostrea cuccullata TaxID=36930 RepID=UPI002ED20FCE